MRKRHVALACLFLLAVILSGCTSSSDEGAYQGEPSGTDATSLPSAPATQVTQPNYEKVPLYRCFALVGARGDHMVSLQQDCEDPNYDFEFKYGSLAKDLAEGTHAVYRCYNPSTGDHGISLKPDCEVDSYRNELLLGYAFDTQGSGMIPIYSCYAPTAVDHMVSLDSDCEADNYTNEFLVGYVFE